MNGNLADYWNGEYYAFALGGAFLLVAAVRITRAVNSATWPQVEGWVTQARAITDGDNQCSVDVDYSYQVDESTYSRTDHRSVWPGTEANAVRLVGSLPPGTPILVSYCPKKPSVAIIRAGVTWDVWVWAALAAGIVGVFFGLKVL